jgi:hypothetical protein
VIRQRARRYIVRHERTRSRLLLRLIPLLREIKTPLRYLIPRLPDQGQVVVWAHPIKENHPT